MTRWIIENRRIVRAEFDGGISLVLREPAPIEEMDELDALASQVEGRFVVNNIAPSPLSVLARTKSSSSQSGITSFIEEEVASNPNFLILFECIAEGTRRRDWIPRHELLKCMQGKAGPDFDHDALRGLVRSVTEAYKKLGITPKIHQRLKTREDGRTVHNYRIHPEYVAAIRAWLEQRGTK